ncbi:MAG TPA: chemotaxis protein CheW [Nitrospiraceae bacterium]|nr:chemotaxis protein CheW [Nitrospiraceae bacterium]
MLRAARGQQQTQDTKRLWSVVVFSVGGMKLAARTEDVEGVSPWTEAIPVPSRTPFVQAMLKRNNHVMPVYDLAARLSRTVQGEPLLCLVARHIDGPMAICIDAYVPSLETVNATAIRPNDSQDIESLGSVTIGEYDVAIVALQRLGRLRQDAVRS